MTFDKITNSVMMLCDLKSINQPKGDYDYFFQLSILCQSTFSSKVSINRKVIMTWIYSAHIASGNNSLKSINQPKGDYDTHPGKTNRACQSPPLKSINQPKGDYDNSRNLPFESVITSLKSINQPKGDYDTPSFTTILFGLIETSKVSINRKVIMTICAIVALLRVFIASKVSINRKVIMT